MQPLWIPRAVPALNVLIEDLGNPSARELAGALDVTERTARRWRADGDAPRAALLALFFASRWGQSLVYCQAANDAALYAALARTLGDENVKLCAEVARLLEVGDFGCANAPVLTVARPAWLARRAAG